jgi:hypothetical protein
LGLCIGNVTILNDNQSTIASIIKSGDFESNKHYRSRINFVKEIIEKEKIKLLYISSKDNIADLFTKLLNGNRVRDLLGLM